MALGTTGGTRSNALPDVPTIKEQGYPSLEFNSWFGIVAPSKTPPEIVAKLSADIIKAVQSPEGKAKMEEAGFRVTGTNREEFARIIAADTVTWGSGRGRHGLQGRLSLYGSAMARAQSPAIAARPFALQNLCTFFCDALTAVAGHSC